MAKVIESRQELYATVSGRCWWCSQYDPAWPRSRREEYGENLAGDTELHEIVEMEQSIGEIPEWAQKIVETSIKLLPPCGHHTFPQPFLDVLSAIGNETPTDFIRGCFTVTTDRKLAMQDYCLCLDGWLSGTSPAAIATDLKARGHRKIDWGAVCQELWDVLGERKEWKRIGVSILLLGLRHMVKDTVCSDCPELDFCPGQYVGDYREQIQPEEGQFFINMTVARYDPSPRLAAMHGRYHKAKPEGLETFGDQWPCAVKTFRFLERSLWSIGTETSLCDCRDVPGFLHAEDTYPNKAKVAEWWKSFLDALHCWWSKEPCARQVNDQVASLLGEHTSVKRWLVRLYAHKLHILTQSGETIGRLVDPNTGTHSGTKELGIG